MTDAQLSPVHVQALARRAIAQLNNAIRTVRIHESSHPSVTAVVEPLAETLNALSQHFDAPLKIELASDVVFFNEVRFRVTATSAAQVELLRAELGARRIGGLAFQRPVKVESLRAYLAVLARKAETETELDQQSRSLVSTGREVGVEMLEERALVSADAAALTARDPRTLAIETYAGLVSAFDTFVTALEEGEDPLGGRLHIVQLVQELIDASAGRLDHLLSLPLLRRANREAFSRAAPRYHGPHAASMCVWAVLIGRVLELDRIALLDLGVSALLGDVGFALLPQQLTDREGSLTTAELGGLQRAMTRASGALLGGGRVDEAMKRHLLVAYEHHAPYVDPRSGAPTDLHVLSRITAVACAFDAMTSDRPWRPAMTQKAALEQLKAEAGARFDPVVVYALGNLLSTYAGFATFCAADG